MRKDKKHKYGAAMSWVARPKAFKYESWSGKAKAQEKLSEEEKAKAFYELAKPKTSSESRAASGKRLASINTEPLYTDDYMELMLSPEEMIDIKKQLNVSPMVRIKKPSALRAGLPNILLADASNKPPTLEEYVKLGLQLSQLSQGERESIQFMLERLKDREEKK